MLNYDEIVYTVVKEHEKVLSSVDIEEIERLLDMVCSAKKIQVFGMGRMQCAARAFVMRLMHMGFDAHIVYDTTCPNIDKGDLLIVNAACTEIGYLVMSLAKKAGANIVAITAQPNSKWGKLYDHTVRLKGQVHPGGAEGEIPSIQPMAALFEQTIFVFEDILIMLLMQRLNITPEHMMQRHTNLDGYLD